MPGDSCSKEDILHKNKRNFGDIFICILHLLNMFSPTGTEMRRVLAAYYLSISAGAYPVFLKEQFFDAVPWIFIKKILDINIYGDRIP